MAESTALEVQPLFDIMRPGRFNAQGEIAYERMAGGGEVHPYGWVRNSAANVLIDDAGITISEGALIFEDDYGETVLTGSGFSGTWDRYIRSGLYNNSFAASTVGSVELPNTFMAGVPYWYFGSNQTYMRAEVMNQAAASGSRAIRIDHVSGSATAANATGSLSQTIPVVGGMKYRFEAAVRHGSITSAKPVTYWANLFWYDHAGTYIGTVSMPSFASPRFVSDATSFFDVHLVTAKAPHNAASVSIQAIAEWPSGLAAGAWSEFSEINSTSSQQVPSRLVYRDTALSIPTGSWTAVTGVSTNDGGEGGASFNRYGGGEYTVDVPGVWDITASVIWATNAAGFRGVALAFSDQATPVMGGNHQIIVPPEPGGLSRIQFNVKKSLVEGNTFLPFVQQNSGGALNITYCRIEAVMVGS